MFSFNANLAEKLKTEYDNCFIVQHIDNKEQYFYFRKAGDDLYFAIFLPDTRDYVYRRLSVDYGLHDHIWAVLPAMRKFE